MDMRFPVLPAITLLVWSLCCYISTSSRPDVATVLMLLPVITCYQSLVIFFKPCQNALFHFFSKHFFNIFLKASSVKINVNDRSEKKIYHIIFPYLKCLAKKQVTRLYILEDLRQEMFLVFRLNI